MNILNYLTYFLLLLLLFSNSFSVSCKTNICNGTDNLMLSGYFAINVKCEPSLRKCYFSKRNVDFTDEVFPSGKTAREFL